MIRIASEQELLDSFRPLDRTEVEISAGMKFPLTERDYLSWSEASGARIYLVFVEPGTRRNFGVVFRRDQTGGAAAQMCEWCHSIRSGNGVGLLTAAASSTRRVGLSLCRDLSCKEKAESDPGPSDFPQNVHERERVRLILRRMASFAKQNLF